MDGLGDILPLWGATTPPLLVWLVAEMRALRLEINRHDSRIERMERALMARRAA